MTKDLRIPEGVSLREALKLLDSGGERIGFVVDADDRLLGTFTDGDARRAILSGHGLEAGIDGVYNPRPVCVVQGSPDQESARVALRDRKLTHLPVTDSEGRLVDYVTATGPSGQAPPRTWKQLDPALPVVIMAGGKGTRMAPFTTVLPKPLIPIGGKTIIELIMEEFAKNRVSRFVLSLNYRGEMIRAYLEGIEHPHTLEYVWEEEFYGTAGSLRLLNGMEGTFIVSNCDIIVRADFADVVSFHRRSGAALTIVSSIQHIQVPYGVVDFTDGGRVTAIREKPEYSMPVNTGVYVLESRCLGLVPEKTVFHMTDLILSLLAAGEKVYTFPVNEKDYKDIGQWSEYRHSVEELGL